MFNKCSVRSKHLRSALPLHQNCRVKQGRSCWGAAKDISLGRSAFCTSPVCFPSLPTRCKRHTRELVSLLVNATARSQNIRTWGMSSISPIGPMTSSATIPHPPAAPVSAQPPLSFSPSHQWASVHAQAWLSHHLCWFCQQEQGETLPLDVPHSWTYPGFSLLLHSPGLHFPDRLWS